MNDVKEKDQKSTKGEKQNPKKANEKEEVKTTEEIRERVVPGGLADREIERIAAAYDQAIRDYETYYQQQMASYQESFNYDTYYSSYDYYPGYKEYSYAKQLGDEYGQALAEYDETLYSLEQDMEDFDSSFHYLQRLEAKEREKYVKEWKEYVQSLLEVSKQLADTIEESIRLISQKTSC